MIFVLKPRACTSNQQINKYPNQQKNSSLTHPFLDDKLKHFTMRLFLTLILAFGLSSPSLFAQNAPDFWSRISPDDVVLTAGAERQMEPLKYVAFKLDYQQIAIQLTQAPKEFTAAARAGTFHVVLPLADGKKETFTVVKR